MAMSAHITRRQATAPGWARLVQSAVVDLTTCPWHMGHPNPGTSSEERQPSGHSLPWNANREFFQRRAYSKGRPQAQHGRAQEQRQKAGARQADVAVHIREFQRPVAVPMRKPAETAEPAMPSLMQVTCVAGGARQEAWHEWWHQACVTAHGLMRHMRVTSLLPSPPATPHACAQALKAAGWSRQEVLNVPNALSMGRLLSGPVIGWWIVQGQVRLGGPVARIRLQWDRLFIDDAGCPVPPLRLPDGMRAAGPGGALCS